MNAILPVVVAIVVVEVVVSVAVVIVATEVVAALVIVPYNKEAAHRQTTKNILKYCSHRRRTGGVSKQNQIRLLRFNSV